MWHETLQSNRSFERERSIEGLASSMSQAPGLLTGLSNFTIPVLQP